ncbi:DNA primase [Chthonomonas calidirosea]|uniref:DNA primase n=1 Tax=Chthonomonas calidirosea TaxID=454171 RepID=UPI0006ECA503|nr:DNA primase [Chthonomonas calidirosea]CEK13484.1 DNA primase, catalytic core [Chthonomonas calidirosea]
MLRDLQALKEEIRAHNDIVDVIGTYVRLQRAGKDYKGLCPFHDDKRPSFHVSPTLQIYKCYACGEGGDVFKFIQKMENLEFLEAMEWLAKRAGIPFDRHRLSGEGTSRREQMLALNRLALEFFCQQLQQHEEAKAYLLNRGVLHETQKLWELGYAPASWDALLTYLKKKGADLSLAAALGLIKSRKLEGSGFYDTFRHRIIFPIHDIGGNIIGFGGRALDPAEPAKYINSDASLLFDKSRVIYGLHFARRKLARDVPPVFVEGYLDVIAAHQAGFTQCVATLGTAFTEHHARILSRYSPKVIICYDSDEAGLRATFRAAIIWESLGIEGAEVRVARLPTGEDPASLLQQPNGIEEFQRALDHAVPRIDFLLERILERHNVQTETGRSDALAEAIALLATVEKLSVRARYADRIAFLHPLFGKTGVERVIEQILADIETAALHLRGGQAPRTLGYPLTEEANRGPLREQPPLPAFRPTSLPQAPASSLRNALPGRTTKRGPSSTPQSPSNVQEPLPPQQLSRAEKAERQLLRALFSAEWRLRLLEYLRPELMVTPYGVKLLDWIAHTPPQADGTIDPRPLLDRALAEEAQSSEKTSSQNSFPFSRFLLEILQDSAYLVSNEALRSEVVDGCLQQLQSYLLEREKRELAQRLQQAVSEAERRDLLEQYHQKVRLIRGSLNKAPNL